METVDAGDEGAFAPWHDVVTRGRRHLRPDDVLPDVDEARASALAGRPDLEPSTSEEVVLLLALEAGEPVGALRVELPLRDNVHVSYGEGWVLPGAAARGRTGPAGSVVRPRRRLRPLAAHDRA